MPLQEDSDALRERLARMEERIKTLETARRAGNTSIEDGALRVKQAGAELMAVGKNVALEGGSASGVRIARPDGTLAMTSLPFTPNGRHRTAIWDQANNAVISDDAVESAGLGRPWIPINMFDYQGTWPSTTSSTFTTLWIGYGFQQHAYLYYVISTSMVPPTVVQFQITATDTKGVTTVLFVSENSNAASAIEGQVKMPDVTQFGEPVKIRIQGRVVSGGGSAFVSPYGMYGKGSPEPSDRPLWHP